MLVKNFTQSDIDICCSTSRATVPMAREGKDDDGKDVIVPGEADVSSEILEAVKDNVAVKWHFQSGNLKIVEEPIVEEPMVKTKATK